MAPPADRPRRDRCAGSSAIGATFSAGPTLTTRRSQGVTQELPSASLLVPPPTPELVAELRSILGPHNTFEESTEGLYVRADTLLAGRAEELVGRMRAYPPVRVAAYADGPRVMRRAEDALRQSALQFERR